jgi:hypothetical protein
MEIMEQEMKFLFGSDLAWITPQDIVDIYGEPLEKRHKKDMTWQDPEQIGIWTFPQGFEIEAATENDYPIVNNYVYFSPSCEMRLSTGIGIGSTKEEVYAAYGEAINLFMTSDVCVTIGPHFHFVLNDNTVISIYIGSGSYSEAFYPDREYPSYEAWRSEW